LSPSPTERPRLLAGRGPLTFRIGRKLTHLGVRGGDRLIELARARGWLACSVRYSLSPTVTLDVPLWRRDNCWDRQDLLAYETRVFEILVPELRRWPRPALLIDAGADIGTFSIKLAANPGLVERIVAFEPNAEAFGMLASNLERLPVPATVYNTAVADFAGRGRLQAPPYDPSAHAWFLVADPSGDTPVQPIDQLGLGPGLGVVLKLDLEGGELAALRGATTTLSRAERFLALVEAHPKVARRTASDPMECARLLRSIRPCRIVVAERPEVEVDVDRPFFEAFPPNRVYNIVAWSTR
jgi:FkbM family methyltransferase